MRGGERGIGGEGGKGKGGRGRDRRGDGWIRVYLSTSFRISFIATVRLNTKEEERGREGTKGKISIYSSSFSFLPLTIYDEACIERRNH